MEIKDLPIKPDMILDDGTAVWSVSTTAKYAGVSYNAVQAWINKARIGEGNIPYHQRKPHTQCFIPIIKFIAWYKQYHSPKLCSWFELYNENKNLLERNKELEEWHRADNNLIERQAKLIESLTKKKV